MVPGKRIRKLRRGERIGLVHPDGNAIWIEASSRGGFLMASATSGHPYLRVIDDRRKATDTVGAVVIPVYG